MRFLLPVVVLFTLACTGMMGEPLDQLPADFPVHADAGEPTLITAGCVDDEGQAATAVMATWKVDEEGAWKTAWFAKVEADGWTLAADQPDAGPEAVYVKDGSKVDIEQRGTLAAVAWWRPGC